MTAALKMLSPATCEVIDRFTSSPESADGLLPFVLPDGRTISPSGLVAALASLSARQVRELGLRMSGIYCPPCTTWSASASLQSSLESRLRARTQNLGSTLYTLTWKAWVTPSGVSRSRLRASVRRTSETATTGWPTPAARDWKDGAAPSVANSGRSDKLTHAAFLPLKGYPTPVANDNRDRGGLVRQGYSTTGDDWKVGGVVHVGRGYWASSRIVPCADGYARIIEPGLEPLAYGVSARVGRLRGYGNAIVPPQAAEFIRAYVEAREGLRAAA